MQSRETFPVGQTAQIVPVSAEHYPPPIIGEKLINLIDRFINAQDVKQSSQQTYLRCLRQFIGWIDIQHINKPGRDDILAYKRHLIATRLSSLTISSYLVVVRKFFAWAENIKMYPNIAQGIKGSCRSKGFKKDSLTAANIIKILGNIDRSTLLGLRDFAILNLLIRTGLRTIEIVRANREDIRQLEGESILWIQGKGRDDKDDFVMLTEGALLPIQEYLKARNQSENSSALFISLSRRNRGARLTTRSIRRIVKSRLADAGFRDKRLSAHSLRHTAITLALSAGASIQEAQAMARHASINTTMIYAHNINRLKNAPERRIEALLAGLI